MRMTKKTNPKLNLQKGGEHPKTNLWKWLLPILVSAIVALIVGLKQELKSLFYNSLNVEITLLYNKRPLENTSIILRSINNAELVYVNDTDNNGRAVYEDVEKGKYIYTFTYRDSTYRYSLNVRGKIDIIELEEIEGGKISIGGKQIGASGDKKNLVTPPSRVKPPQIITTYRSVPAWVVIENFGHDINWKGRGEYVLYADEAGLWQYSVDKEPNTPILDSITVFKSENKILPSGYHSFKITSTKNSSVSKTFDLLVIEELSLSIKVYN